MIGYIIIQGIAAALLWGLFAACYLWDEKAQTPASYGFSVFTLFTASTFTTLVVGDIIKMAGVQ